jgi:methylmalonyl-CoA mutase
MTNPHAFPPVPFDAWTSAVESELRGRPASSLDTKLAGGLTVHPLEVARPASTHPAERSSTHVLVAPRHAHPEPEAVRRAVQDDALGGATGLFLQFGRACRFGLDGDHPAALEHLVEGGTAIGSARDLATALELGAAQLELLAFDAGANAVPLLALTEATLERLGVERAKLTVHAGFDPVGALLRDGAVPADLDYLWREAASTLAAVDQTAAPTKLVVADGTAAHNAGADPALEIAIQWGSALEAFDRLTSLGVTPYDAAQTIVFRVAVGRDVFVELAKIRALRLGWQKILHAAGLASAPAATVHACVASRMLSRRDPWVNMLRGTGALWSALLGGADVVTPAAWDEAIGEPDGTTRRIARNQALMLLEESHLASPLDPALGSYALEALTSEIGEKAWALLQGFEAEGGIVDAVEAGTVQAKVRAAAEERLDAIVKRKEPVIGVGEFPNLEERPVVRRDVRDRKSATSLADIAATSRRMRASAPPPAFGKVASFAELRELATKNATVSEIGRALSRKGEGPSVERVRPMRDAAPFERLRDRVERLARGRGKAPTITLVTMGSAEDSRIRTAYASQAFAAAGFRTSIVAADALEGAVAGAACLCTSDAVLELDGVAAARKVRALGATPLVVAGQVPSLREPLADAGVTHTLFAGGDLIALLEALVVAEESRP